MMTEISVQMQKVIIQLAEENGALEEALANARTGNERLTVANGLLETLLRISNNRVDLYVEWVEEATSVIQHGFDLMPVKESLAWGGAKRFLSYAPRKGQS